MNNKINVNSLPKRSFNARCALPICIFVREIFDFPSALTRSSREIRLQISLYGEIYNEANVVNYKPST